MARIFTGLAVWNLVFLSAAVATGFLRGGAVPARYHLLTGLFSAMFCCLLHAIVFAHFIGSGKWIKRGVEAAGMDAAIVARTRRFKAKTFPFALFSMLLVVATAVLGGGTDTGSVSPTLHLVLALLTLSLNVVATFFERSAIRENSGLIDRVVEANRARIAEGIPAADLPSAQGEATVAASKVCFFLAANVWLLFVYRWQFMRIRDEPFWPYLAASLALFFLGLRLRR